MEDIHGKKIYIRKTEEKILRLWKEGISRKITGRDVLACGDAGKIYRLWNTDLVAENLETGEIKINVTGNDGMVDVYYRYGRQKDVIMTQTTKRRLNAFLAYYGFDTLEVHSSMKEWCVRHNGKELSIDSWYRLDFATKELVKC